MTLPRKVKRMAGNVGLYYIPCGEPKAKARIGSITATDGFGPAGHYVSFNDMKLYLLQDGNWYCRVSPKAYVKWMESQAVHGGAGVP